MDVIDGGVVAIVVGTGADRLAAFSVECGRQGGTHRVPNVQNAILSGRSLKLESTRIRDRRRKECSEILINSQTLLFIRLYVNTKFWRI
jgi:hypothetical protein